MSLHQYHVLGKKIFPQILKRCQKCCLGHFWSFVWNCIKLIYIFFYFFVLFQYRQRRKHTYSKEYLLEKKKSRGANTLGHDLFVGNLKKKSDDMAAVGQLSTKNSGHSWLFLSSFCGLSLGTEELHEKFLVVCLENSCCVSLSNMNFRWVLQNCKSAFGSSWKCSCAMSRFAACWPVSGVSLDICFSRWPKQASSTHRRRTAQTQPCASSASRSWRAGSRRTNHSKASATEQLQSKLFL